MANISVIITMFYLMVIPVAESATDNLIHAVQTSDYTFILNAILLIIASVTFILVRIKRNKRNKK